MSRKYLVKNVSKIIKSIKKSLFRSLFKYNIIYIITIQYIYIRYNVFFIEHKLKIIQFLLYILTHKSDNVKITS